MIFLNQIWGIILTAISGQDRVTGTRLTFSCKIAKTKQTTKTPDKIYETTVLTSLDIRQVRSVILRDKKAYMSPKIAPSFCLQK